MKLKPFIISTLRDGKPRTVTQLADLLHVETGVNNRHSLSKAVRQLLDAGQIEPAAGHARAGGDGIMWKDENRGGWNTGTVCRAYRLVEVPIEN